MKDCIAKMMAQLCGEVAMLAGSALNVEEMEAICVNFKHGDNSLQWVVCYMRDALLSKNWIIEINKQRYLGLLFECLSLYVRNLGDLIV